MGSSSGSQGSGTVEYPQYLEDAHEDLLEYLWVGTSGSAGPIAAITATNPFTAAVAYDPTTRISLLSSELSAFNTFLMAHDDITYDTNFVTRALRFDDPTDYTFPDILSTITVMATLLYELDTNLFTEGYIDNVIDAFSDKLDDQLADTVAPKFTRGMQDVNADMSSAFVIGMAKIHTDRNLQVSDFQAKIRIDNENRILELEKLKPMFNANRLEHEKLKTIFDNLTMQYHDMQSKFSLNQDLIQKDKEKLTHAATIYEHDYDLGLMQAYAALNGISLDKAKLTIIAEKEQKELDYGYQEKYYAWSLDQYQKYANMIGSIAGTAVNTGNAGAQGPSALGGMISGAGIGGMIGAGTAVGGPWGAALGAGAGLIGSLLS